MKLGPGHTHGQCIISDKHKLCFILIPKNMSSSMRKYIKVHLEGREYNYFNCSPEQKDYFTFCVCREVKSRFYSAIDTILSRKINKISKMNDANLKLYVYCMADEHIVKQSEFIKDINIDMFVNMEMISKYLHTSNESKNITHEININRETIDDVYHDDMEMYEQSKNMDLNKFLNKLKLNVG